MKITKVHIIGIGKIGSAITHSLVKDYQVEVFDRSSLAIQTIVNKLKEKISVVEDLPLMLNSNKPLIVAVKPHQIQEVVRKVPNNRLIISIAAGISLEMLNSWRSQKGPIIRAMPNMPIKIGFGMTCLMGNTFVNSDIMHSVQELFSRGGETMILEDEAAFHSITALSGSGPAFVYLFLQALEDAGVHFGLDRKSARKLVLQTTLGSVSLAKESLEAPQNLIHDITSPGGTTIEAITSLKKDGFESSLNTAMECAMKRSKSLYITSTETEQKSLLL